MARLYPIPKCLDQQGCLARFVHGCLFVCKLFVLTRTFFVAIPNISLLALTLHSCSINPGEGEGSIGEKASPIEVTDIMGQCGEFFAEGVLDETGLASRELFREAMSPTGVGYFVVDGAPDLGLMPFFDDTIAQTSKKKVNWKKVERTNKAPSNSLYLRTNHLVEFFSSIEHRQQALNLFSCLNAVYANAMEKRSQIEAVSLVAHPSHIKPFGDWHADNSSLGPTKLVGVITSRGHQGTCVCRNFNYRLGTCQDVSPLCLKPLQFLFYTAESETFGELRESQPELFSTVETLREDGAPPITFHRSPDPERRGFLGCMQPINWRVLARGVLLVDGL